MMTKELNAVRTFTIKYTVGRGRKIHEFTTDKLMEAQKQYESFTSFMGKKMFAIKIVSSSFDGELSHEEWLAYSPANVSGFRGRLHSNLLIYCTLTT